MSDHVKIDNARDPEQAARMLRHAKENRCHFCPEGFGEHRSPVEKLGVYWFIARNDFPYKGSVHHYLIVSRTHITNIEEISVPALQELFEYMIPFLKEKLDVSGFSLFVRSGNMSFTAATLDHIHFHFVVGVEKEKANHPIIVGPLGYQSE